MIAKSIVITWLLRQERGRSSSASIPRIVPTQQANTRVLAEARVKPRVDWTLARLSPHHRGRLSGVEVALAAAARRGPGVKTAVDRDSRLGSTVIDGGGRPKSYRRGLLACPPKPSATALYREVMLTAEEIPDLLLNSFPSGWELSMI